MRVLAIATVVLLVGCAPFTDQTRVDSLTPGDAGGFTYSAATNTVMTANEDGEAERIRREWLAESLTAAGLCSNGYQVESRRFVQVEGVFANGGDIVYAGRCL
jgi:hypothetical protein